MSRDLVIVCAVTVKPEPGAITLPPEAESVLRGCRPGELVSLVGSNATVTARASVVRGWLGWEGA